MNDYVKIYGKLTDFDGNPISRGDVDIYDADFTKYVYTTQTDELGNYSLEIKKGIYMALSAVKDYAVKKLEYWCWHLAAFEDMEINIRIDRLEVYGLNAFLIQREIKISPFMIYFRPMSLKRYLQKGSSSNTEPIIDISPNLSKEDIEVTINDQNVAVLELHKIFEQVIERPQKIIAYLMQVSTPDIENEKGYIKIHVAIKDNETGEKGEGSLFWQIPKSFDFFER